MADQYERLYESIASLSYSDQIADIGSQDLRALIDEYLDPSRCVIAITHPPDVEPDLSGLTL